MVGEHVQTDLKEDIVCCTACKRFVCAAFSSPTVLSQSLKFLWWDKVERLPADVNTYIKTCTHALTHAAGCRHSRVQGSDPSLSGQLAELSAAASLMVRCWQPTMGGVCLCLCTAVNRLKTAAAAFINTDTLVENTVLLLLIQAEQGSYSEHIFAEWCVCPYLNPKQKKWGDPEIIIIIIFKPSSVKSTTVKKLRLASRLTSSQVSVYNHVHPDSNYICS